MIAGNFISSFNLKNPNKKNTLKIMLAIINGKDDAWLLSFLLFSILEADDFSLESKFLNII